MTLGGRKLPETVLGAALLASAAGLGLIGCAEPASESAIGGASGAEPDQAASPWFEEVSSSAGLDFAHRSGEGDRKLFPEIMGGGVALFDMDGDGDLDAYLVQSGSLWEPESEPDGNKLYENRGDGTFVDVTDGSGADDRGYGMGVAAGDYDDDGDADLFVTNYGPDVLLRNDGRGRFTDVTAEAGVGNPKWGTSATFVDYDTDGDLDLFVANYVNWTLAIEQDCYNSAGLLDYCLPINYRAPIVDTLYRNNGDGTFTDVSVAAGLQAAFGNGLGVVHADFNGDGRVDIFVANDTMLNQLWVNQGDGTFIDEALLRGCALDEHGQTKAGMGVMVSDIDDDGDEDLLVVNFEGQTDSFFVNEDGLFRDCTGEMGLAAVGRAFTRFGVGLQDFDNDGFLDLYQSNGRAVLSLEPETDDPFAESNVLLRGTGDGRFEEVLPRGGTAEPLIHTSRAAAFGDVDADGGVDVVVVNRDGPLYLLRNLVSQRGHWLRIRVVEPSGRDALGAKVTVRLGDRSLTRVVRAAYSYCSSSDPAIHLGLGDRTEVDSIVVKWPEGETRTYGPQDVDQTIVLSRGG
jgi:hypothetical protein